jgi:hypothetical protein
MRALLAAVVIMGVLIVAGVVTVVVTVAQRVAGTAGPAVASQTLLDEPAGTRITGTALAPDRLALTLQGGGPDRVVVLDPRSGRIVARAALAR